MAAQSYGFRAVWRRKRPVPSLLVFRLRRRSSKVLQAHRLNIRSNDGERENFFFDLRGSFKCMIVIYQLFDATLPLWSSPHSWLAICFTRDDSRTFVPTVPRWRRAFTGRNIEVVVHSKKSASSVVVFFPPADPVTSFLSQPISAVILGTLAFNRTKPLSPRSPSSRKPSSNVQLVPACVTSGNIHYAVSRHFDKNRGKQMNCFLNEQDPREQSAINELTKKTPWRHATTTTSVAGL